ncbi:MAG: alanine--glyoxylate aminotransferase family protein [Ruminococcus sp.]|nr:alanine--glyoxylate aminotransferase family protein [Ruminococcus sp.]
MKLFTLGPVEMYDHTFEVAKKQVPYFRTPEFSEVVLECDGLLRKFAKAGSDAKTVFLTCSGTGAMEATVINCFDEKDKLLVIDGGSFGHRFAQICEIHGIPHDVIKLPYGTALKKEDVYAFDGKGYTGLLVNIDETSTGQLYDGKMLSEFCKKNGMIFVVDAISSFLADPIDMEDWGIDALIFSSQKSLALAPGLSIVLLSSRMYTERVQGKPAKTMYLDFNSHIENGKRGQTPFTPAVRLIYELQDMLRHIDAMGLESKLAHMKEVADDFRARLAETPLSLPEYPLSNAVTPLYFPDGNAYEVYETLKKEYDVFVTPNGGDLAKTVIRVGHLGNHTVEDNKMLIDLFKKVLNR